MFSADLYLQTIDEIVDLTHKALHEDDLGQTNAQITQFGWKCLHLAEVVQLHGCN